MKTLDEITQIAREYGRPNPDYWSVGGVPPAVARELLNDEGDMDEYHNSAPTHEEMLEICESHNGTLEGYIIPKESGRNDARVMFDGFTLDTDELSAHRLAVSMHPDEFDQTNNGWRFWWD